MNPATTRKREKFRVPASYVRYVGALLLVQMSIQVLKFSARRKTMTRYLVTETALARAAFVWVFHTCVSVLILVPTVA